MRRLKGCALFVQNRENCRWVHSVAQAYGVRPSALLGIGDAWAALQFDTAVLCAVSAGESTDSDRAARGDWRGIV